MQLCEARQVTKILSRHVSAQRLATLQSVLSTRAACAHIVLENLSDPHNAAACLRTADVLGVQHVHVVQSHSPFIPVERAAIECIKEETLRSHTGRGRVGAATSPAAMGSAKWLQLHHHDTIMHAYEHLEQHGVTVLASSLGDRALPLPAALSAAIPKPLRTSTLPAADDAVPATGHRSGGGGRCSHPNAAQVALVFGNERRGTSAFAREHCEQLWYLPQRGLAQSLNVGVALGIATNTLMEHLQNIGSVRESPAVGAAGGWRGGGSESGGGSAAGCMDACPPGNLHPEDCELQLAAWLLRDVRSADAILRRHNVQLQQW